MTRRTRHHILSALRDPLGIGFIVLLATLALFS